MRVIGTAGHVDHGKSTLIEALTGTHPDRLKEERQREMTIDLGFAWWTLPNGEEVGVVDVPGHRDFIENMLSGIAGIDAVLLVVAADEGVMPQTREHLAILDILQTQAGVVALTKTDMVGDPDWIELVEQEVRQVLADTALAEAPIVRVSAKTGEGLEALQAALQAVIAEQPARPDLGRPRLPIDRIFTMPGFGTVVTGTLSDGHLRVGEAVEILPGALQGRIRGLQTHKRSAEVAVPGSRTAVNISGVDLAQVQRGQVVARPGAFAPTRRLDLHFRHLPDASQPLRHNSEVKLFIGAAQVVARLRLLGADTLEPGQAGWLQLELRDPVVAIRGDRYILRRPSPGETLGGGIVMDAHPKRRHKRFSEAVLARLQALAEGSPAEVLLQSVLALGAAPLKQAIEKASLEAQAAEHALQELLAAGQLLSLDGDLEKPGGDSLVTSQSYWDSLAARTLQQVADFHRAQPLRQGMSRQELKSRLGVDQRLFNALVTGLVASGELSEAGPLVLAPGHQIVFSPEQQRAVDALLARFAQAPYGPPSIKECQQAIGEDVYLALVDLGRLLPVSAEVVFRQEDYAAMLADVRSLIAEHGPLTVAQARDHFKTTRRYILAFLEYLDTTGVTVRDGDARRLK
ncbi:MAG: selenocysteine-specific translation elongation factor [Anaerolineae bacterium]|nr:selenocysteine-specific translation elongation factor [Anaerolineae bacterium]